jgi:alkylation response protein AidB-like acyl-CoA dehydrogenase
MRIEDSPDEARFRAEARAWLDAHAQRRSDGEAEGPSGPRHSPEAEAEHFRRSRAWQATLFDGGWAAIPWPAEYGGRGGSPAQEMIFAEELANYDVSSGFLSSTIGLVAPALMQHGNEQQRSRYLRRLLRGDDAWCQLFSEPNAGSDLAALRTRADRDGDDFVIHGQKLWTTSAQYCDLGLLLARTNPELPKHRGITCFIADMRDPGVDIRPLVTITGGTHFNEVFFADVRIPAENVIGEVDGGWAVARTTLAHESVMIGTASTGTREVDQLLKIARDRGVASDPRVQRDLARVYTNECVLGLFRTRLQAAVRAGRMPDVDGSVMKVFWAESRAFKDEVALGLLGSQGLLDGDDAIEHGRWQGQYLDFAMGTIGGGTCEVHRNGIGERVLGLPREPRSDRDAAFCDLKV